MAGIRIGGEPEYRQPVSSIMDTIFKNPIGHVIVTMIQKGSKDVGIYPRGKAAGDDDAASASPIDHQDAAPKGVSARGPDYFYACHADSLYTTDKDERFGMAPARFTGTGSGSLAKIEFSPERVKTDKVWDSRPDVTLLHELVHALRIAQGLRSCVPTKDPDWMNEEEFWAVIVANVYLCAGGSTRLRDGYHSETRMEPPKNTSAGFLDHETRYGGKPIKTNLEIFEKHARAWSRVYTACGMVPGLRFNPFREYLGRHM